MIIIDDDFTMNGMWWVDVHCFVHVFDEWKATGDRANKHKFIYVVRAMHGLQCWALTGSL